MNYTVDQTIASSLLLYLDNLFLNYGQAYTLVTGQFKPQTDSKFPANYNIYAAPNNQWVADSSISTVPVISGVYCSGQFIPRNTSGCTLDFLNGRVFLTGSGTNNLKNVSGVYCKKDFNFYLGTEYITQAFLERTLNGQQNYLNNYPSPYTYVMPAVFISPQIEKNVPFALGGAKTKKFSFSVTIISDNNTNFYGAKSLITDSLERQIPIISNSDTPYNYFGDLKGGNYNYSGLVQTYAANSNNQAYIKNVIINAAKTFRGKVLNFEEFFISYGTVELEIYNYFTPALI